MMLPNNSAYFTKQVRGLTVQVDQSRFIRAGTEQVVWIYDFITLIIRRLYKTNNLITNIIKSVICVAPSCVPGLKWC